MVNNFNNNKNAHVDKYIIIFHIRAQNTVTWNSAVTIFRKYTFHFTLGRNN